MGCALLVSHSLRTMAECRGLTHSESPVAWTWPQTQRTPEPLCRLSEALGPALGTARAVWPTGPRKVRPSSGHLLGCPRVPQPPHPPASGKGATRTLQTGKSLSPPVSKPLFPVGRTHSTGLPAPRWPPCPSLAATSVNNSSTPMERPLVSSQGFWMGQAAGQRACGPLLPLLGGRQLGCVGRMWH